MKEAAERLATEKELLENDTTILAEEKEKLMKVEERAKCVINGQMDGRTK